MNYLAHLLLAGPEPASLIGNLLGDFVKGPLADVSGPFRDGIAMHRAVDRFTDAHPVVLASKGRIAPRYRRFAGVIVDLCYDHYLARDWERYAEVPLDEFCARAYDLLEEHQAELPERLQRALPHMRAYDWLGSYREPEGIVIALDRIAGRLKRGERFLGSGQELLANYEALGEDFVAFFPQVQAFALTLLVSSCP